MRYHAYWDITSLVLEFTVLLRPHSEAVIFGQG